MKQTPRVAFVHNIDPAIPNNSWVVTFNSFKRAFERHVGTVIDLGPTPISFLPYRIARRLLRAATGRIYSFHHDLSLARRLAAYFTRKLEHVEADVIFIPSGSSIAAYIETDLPIILYNDATWPLLRGYYEDYSRTIASSTRGAIEIEARAMARADVLVFPTAWAADSAVAECGADAAKVVVIAPGANLPDPPEHIEAVPLVPGSTARLLFVGMRWAGKGGDIALEALVALEAMGIDAELTIVGCTPPPGVSHPRMRVIPFLNKGVEADRRTFDQLWRAATFFILPTRFEAAGMVFCEASAYGVPSLATDTGGVSSIVREGINGHVLPLDAGGAAYARLAAEILADPGRYVALRRSSRREYETRLNWRAWGERMAEVVEATIAKARRANLPHAAAPTERDA